MSPLLPATFRVGVWEALCRAGFHCPTVATLNIVGRFADEEACRSHRPIPSLLLPDLDFLISVEQGRAAFRPELGRECLDRLYSRFCWGQLDISFGYDAAYSDLFVPEIEACVLMVEGLIDKGGECRDGIECAPGGVCSWSGIPDEECPLQCVTDECLCAPDEFCVPSEPPDVPDPDPDAARFLCEKRRGEGESCRSMRECGWELACIDDTCQFERPPVTVQFPGLGEPCLWSACGPGLTCVARWTDDASVTEKCEAPLGEGAECLADRECIVGLRCIETTGIPDQYGSCERLAAVGDWCWDSFQCESFNCLGKRYGQPADRRCGTEGAIADCVP